uniref:Vacuolar protein sorting-associated protein 29 n=1 Tax=Dracunculus medinensis TaxID=318479 RepID=A0A0N4U235_DRAME
LVLVIGDFHIPLRSHGIPAKFRKLLVPNKMQHILCTGNMCTREIIDYLRSLASDVHVVRGDCDDFGLGYPETKVLTVGQFKIGLCHGHQIVPWGDIKRIELLARELNVDVMVTGHTHQCRTFEHEDRFFIDPGSVTGAFSPIQSEVVPSFGLLDVQSNTIFAYIYRLIDDQVKVERMQYRKQSAS